MTSPPKISRVSVARGTLSREGVGRRNGIAASIGSSRRRVNISPSF
jgi:hypothetical protein